MRGERKGRGGVLWCGHPKLALGVDCAGPEEVGCKLAALGRVFQSLDALCFCWVGGFVCFCFVSVFLGVINLKRPECSRDRGSANCRGSRQRVRKSGNWGGSGLAGIWIFLFYVFGSVISSPLTCHEGFFSSQQGIFVLCCIDFLFLFKKRNCPTLEVLDWALRACILAKGI